MKHCCTNATVSPMKHCRTDETGVNWSRPVPKWSRPPTDPGPAIRTIKFRPRVPPLILRPVCPKDFELRLPRNDFNLRLPH